MPHSRMPSINQVALTGTLTQDPEARQTENKRFRIRFTLSADRNEKQRNGQPYLTSVPVLAWDQLAEYAAERLAKGTAVFITGHLHSTGTALGVTARHIQFLPTEPPSNRKDHP